MLDLLNNRQREIRIVMQVCAVLVTIIFLFGLPDSLVQSSIRLATPFVLGSLGALLASRAGVLNLAIEGKMLLGAFVGVAVLFQSGLDPLVGVIAAPVSAGILGLVFAARIMRGISWITGPIRADHVRQALEQRILVGANHDHAIAAGINAGRGDPWQDRTASFARVAGQGIFRDQAFHEGHDAFIDRRIDDVPATCFFAVVQRNHRAKRRKCAGHRVAKADAGARRRAVRFAD